jgi:hypothetical protein
MVTARVSAIGILPTAHPASEAQLVTIGVPYVNDLAVRRDRRRQPHPPELLAIRGNLQPVASSSRTRLVA